MNYCKKCGNKIKKGAKFCKNCGFNLIKKEVKEISSESIILYLGIFLVVFSSILFAFISWKNLSNILKVIFLFSEVILFFILSLVSKKLKNKNSFNACYFISMLFLPITLYLIKYYNLIPIFFKWFYDICLFINNFFYLFNYLYYFI